MMKKQRGFGLYGTLLSLVILSVVTTGLAKGYLLYIDKRKASEYRGHIERVIEQLQKYHYNKVSAEGESPHSPDVWPKTLGNLMTDYSDQFWPLCTAGSARQGLCRRPDTVPWSTQALGYSFTYPGAIPTANLTFPLSAIRSQNRGLWASELMRLPFASKQANGDIVVSVKDPMMSQMNKSFVNRNGNTKLIADWDIGGKNGIVNVRDITLVNADGSQTSVATGLIRSQGMAKHGEWVNMPSCPLNRTATQSFSFAGNIPNTVSNDFTDFGPAKTYVLSKDSTRWQVGLDYVAEMKSNGQKYTIHSGAVNYFTFCQ